MGGRLDGEVWEIPTKDFPHLIDPKNQLIYLEEAGYYYLVAINKETNEGFYEPSDEFVQVDISKDS